MKILNIFFASLIILSFFCVSSWSTSLGEGMQPLAVREITKDVYVISVLGKNQELESVQLLWLPKSDLENCIGQSYNLCREFDRQRRMKLMQEGKNNTEVPRRLLDSWVIKSEENLLPQNNDIINELVKRNWIKEKVVEDRQNELMNISDQFKIKAKIRWELWPNGENFQVLKVY